MKGYAEALFADVDAVNDFIRPLRAAGKSIVTTNGCFDLLHTGHIQYLEEAAVLGDVLLVGVNGDAVVSKLKGKNRPVQGECDRVKIISSLKMVDGAFLFQEDDPRAFLSVLKPDIHVKGGDYTQNIIEKDIVESNGGKVVIVSYKKGYSATGLVKKILNG